MKKTISNRILPVISVLFFSALSGDSLAADSDILKVHVVVALADNWHQRIVPVPLLLGNGDDPVNNLYWGARYGLDTFFTRDAGWTKIAEEKFDKRRILRRILLQKKVGKKTIMLLAEAYRGREIKAAIQDFLSMAAGHEIRTFKHEKKEYQFGSGAQLLAYLGHDGLMEFNIAPLPQYKPDSGKRDAIVLACISRKYFKEPLAKAKARPVVWSTGLMAAEAYPLAAALDAWAKGLEAEAIRDAAAGAYAKYQKISKKAARRLLVSGF
jgi:hypothetical protein